MLPGTWSPCRVIKVADTALHPQWSKELWEGLVYPQEHFFLQSQVGIYDNPGLLAKIYHFPSMNYKKWNKQSGTSFRAKAGPVFL